MAKILTVEEALKEIAAKENAKGILVLNRFSKKNFNTLMTAMVNDVKFTEKVVKKAGDDGVELENILVTESFRKWLKNVVEKLGVDSNDSKVIMTDNFKINNMDGVYDFFLAAVYEYMKAGNKFDIPAHEDFKGSIYLKDVDKTTKVNTARNPITGETIGDFEVTKKKHKVLAVKSSCPTYLSSKRKI